MNHADGFRGSVCWGFSLAGDDSHEVNAVVRKGGVERDGEEIEATCRTYPLVCLHGAGLIPGARTKMKDQGKDDKPDDGDDLDTNEAELCLTIDGHSKDIQAEDGSKMREIHAATLMSWAPFQNSMERSNSSSQDNELNVARLQAP